MSIDPAIARELAELIRRSSRILFITGAGLSADSGLPTYRGVGGLYNDGGTEEGIPIEVALSGQMLEIRPELCWKHIHRIEEACRGARFNRAHQIMATIENQLTETCVLTQNVDGFHRDAGSKNLIEIHGNIRELMCTACQWRTEVTSYAELNIPPSCPECGELVRPDVVLFGEMLPSRKLGKLQAELSAGFDLVMSVGTTSVFPYIAGPVVAAARAGIPTVEINPGDTEVSEAVDIRVKAGAAATFEMICTELELS